MKKFIASVVIVGAASVGVLGAAGTAEARPPSYCGGKPALCTQPFPFVPSNKPIPFPSAKERAEFQERSVIAGKAALKEIKHHLGIDE